jgi:hypothetical protein
VSLVAKSVNAIRVTAQTRNAAAPPMDKWVSIVLQQLAEDPDDKSVRAIVVKAREEGLLK